MKWFDSIPEVKLQKIITSGLFYDEGKPGRNFCLPDWSLGSE